MTETAEVWQRWGEWYGATGEQMIEWIADMQAKAREAIPDQDIRLKIYTAWGNKLEIEAIWDRPISDEEILRGDHYRLMEEAKSLNADRLVVLKYQEVFPRQEHLDRLIAEIESIEAQMKLMDLTLSQTIREELGLEVNDGVNLFQRPRV